MRKSRKRRFLFVAYTASVAAVALTLAGCANCPQSDIFSAPYAVVHVAEAPIIDGKLDDPAWQQAAVLDTFYEFGKTAVRFPGDVKAMIVWDAENLYFGITVKDKDIFVASRGRDPKVCGSDAVELFLKPPVVTEYETELYEFEFNAWEAIWDIHYLGCGGGSAAVRFSADYNPAIVCKATHTGTINDGLDKDEEYTVEVSIPLSAFSHAVPDGAKPGDVWKFNVAGYDFSVYRRNPALFTTMPGKASGFSQYELFTQMKFMPFENALPSR